jgi:GT2 family glycosyltransferase
MDLSVIIVNHNVKDLLARSLMSIYSGTRGITFEVIVVDNASNDGSIEYIREKFSEAKIIRLEENTGFAKANNMGIKEARGKYLLLLNPDTLVVENALTVLVQFMNGHPETGVAGAKLLNRDGTLQASARSFPTPLTVFFGRTSILTRLFPNNKFTRRDLICTTHDSDDPLEVDWVSGACLITRRDVIEQVGLLDERYFMYWEDADWCYRIKKAGWKVFYIPKARIIHYAGESSKSNGNRMITEFHKSVYYYYRKNHIGSPLSPINFITFFGLSFRAIVKIAFNVLRGR